MGRYPDPKASGEFRLMGDEGGKRDPRIAGDPVGVVLFLRFPLSLSAAVESISSVTSSSSNLLPTLLPPKDDEDDWC